MPFGFSAMKAAPLARILLGGAEPASAARRLMEGSANVTWLTDRAAAADIGGYPVEYVRPDLTLGRR